MTRPIDPGALADLADEGERVEAEQARYRELAGVLGSVSVEQELDALRACVEALDGIDHDPAALSRAIRYLADRYGS